MKIAKHSVVEMGYTLTDGDGKVLDSSEGGEPFVYLHGVGTLIPGLESALEGQTAGEQLQVTVPPADGYGERNAALCQQVPRSEFQGVDELKEGMQFRVPTDEGQVVVTVTDVGDETVTIDGNHPLAGNTLHFDVAVLNVREATAEEIEHGHVHGPGGHQH